MVKNVEKYEKCGMQYDSNFIKNLESYFDPKNIEGLYNSKEPQERIRQEFKKKFNKDYIENMKIDDFVSKVSVNNRKDTFCYILENVLDGLGKMKGATVQKFGVYYSVKRHKEECTKKFSKTKDVEEGFKNIKKEICELIELGEQYNPNKADDSILDKIDKNKIAPLFKGKILSTYYPEKFVNIFAPIDIERYLQILNIQYDSNKIKGWERKKRLLLEFKQKDVNFSKHSNLFFSGFLYTYYSRKKDKEKELNSYSNKEKEILNKIPKKIIELKIDYKNIQEIKDWNAEPKKTAATRKRNNKSTQEDIETSEINRKIIGDEGEKAVVEYEKAKLKKWKSSHVNDVKRISKERPSAGYDIVSYDKEENEIHIEVKTSLKKYMEFHITSNEYKTMQEDIAYRIYYLNNAKSSKFNLYIFGKDKLDKQFFQPATYRVRAEIITNNEKIDV